MSGRIALNPNVERIAIVARRLGPLCPRVAFLGGATTHLFITDEAAPEPRATLDVDVVIEVASRLDYYELEGQLRDLGFSPVPDGPICRWTIEGVLVDVMPTDPSILGFSNTWSSPAIENAEDREVAPETTIRIVAPAYFLATKLEAFAGRGQGDYPASPDIEDIIAVVDGRREIIEELAAADDEVRRFVARTLDAHLSEQRFRESIYGHLPPDSTSQGRAPTVLERLSAIARLGH